MKIALGSDHGGFDLKSAIKKHLEELGHEVVDFGTDSHDSCDYPLIAEPAAKAVASGECDRGILICGTGIGIGIAANKVPGVRAALVHDTFSAKACRNHNDANMITMGQRVIGEGLTPNLKAAVTNAVSTKSPTSKNVTACHKIDAIWIE